MYMYPFMLFCTSVNYITYHTDYLLQLILWSITVQATLINFGIVPLSFPKCVCTLDEK